MYIFFILANKKRIRWKPLSVKMGHGWCPMSRRCLDVSEPDVSFSGPVWCHMFRAQWDLSHQASASPQLQWSRATAQISTSSRTRPALPSIGRGPLWQPPGWLSQTIASSVDTQQHQLYCTKLHHDCKVLLRETISSVGLKIDREFFLG